MVLPVDNRTEAQKLRSLVENGVAKRFDLRAWSDKGCAQATAVERLDVLLEQVRPDVAKLIVLEELEGTSEEDTDALVYGEIDMHDFMTELLDKYGGTSAGGGGGGDGTGRRIFVDLGSGTGKAVMAAGLCRHFSHVWGIELLPCTSAIAELLIEDYVRDVLPGARPASNPLLSCSVERGDFFQPDVLARWTGADFVFCNCVTWDQGTMDAMSAAAERMRPGALFVTVLCPLSGDKFELVDEAELKFSWGFVEALVHRRMTDDAAALGAMLGDSMSRMRGADDMEHDASS